MMVLPSWILPAAISCEGFGERHAEDFDLLVEFGGGDAGADVAGEVDLHPLAEEAGAGEVSE